MPTRKSVAAPRSIILNVRDPAPSLGGENYNYTPETEKLAELHAALTFRENNILWLYISMYNPCRV